MLVPSGLAAIGNVALALLKTGDEVLVPDNAYGPNKAMGSAMLAQFGVQRVLTRLEPPPIWRPKSPLRPAWSGWRRRAR